MSIAAALAGCGARAPRPAALRLERADLLLLARTLQRLAPPVHREVAAARRAWPSLAGGLPRSGGGALELAVTSADARAGRLALPAFVTVEGGLTGPAAGIGGLLKSYTRLTQRGWRLTAAALRLGGSGEAAGEGSPASFLRANSGLYIYCVYDGHYDLSLIGKKLQNAYDKLGGASAFGAALTAARIQALAQEYSIPATRLEPHPLPGVHV